MVGGGAGEDQVDAEQLRRRASGTAFGPAPVRASQMTIDRAEQQMQQDVGDVEDGGGGQSGNVGGVKQREKE